MSKSSKPRKPAAKKTLKESAPETPVEPEVNSGLTPEEPAKPEPETPPESKESTGPGIDVAEPQSQSQAASPDPCADVKPWIGDVSHILIDNGEDATLIVTFTVARGDSIVPLGRIDFYDNSRQLPSVHVPAGLESWTTTISFTIPYTTQEGHTFNMQLFNACGPGHKWKDFGFSFEDKTAPDFEIVSPKDGATVPYGVPLKVQGWAEDRQSGVAAVEYSLNGEKYKQVPIVPGRRVDWQFDISLESGVHTIAMQCRDGKDNQKTEPVITITAAGEYKPESDLASLRAYLYDLLQYAENHVKVGNAKLTKAVLTNLFYQPFEQLIDIRNPSGVPLGNQPVNQLQAAIEVLRRYLAAVPNERPGEWLVAHWQCDDGSGTKLSDSSSHGHHGTLFNKAAWTHGKLDGALSFDGDDYAQIPNAPALEVGKNDADFSVTFWMYLREEFTGNRRSIVHKGNESMQRNFGLWMHSDDNRIYYAISTTDNPDQGSNSLAQIALNAWTHVAYIKTGNRLKLYINGKLDSETPPLTGKSVSNDGPLSLGKDPWHPGINGILDDVRVYNGALSEEFVQRLAEGLAGGVVSPTEMTTEYDYRLAAYRALLNRMGASDEEIRLARGAEDEARQALASRLGIALDPGTNQLEQLYLTGDNLSEAKLGELFGLDDTTRNPLTVVPDPLLLRWRRDYLEALWHGQDDDERSQPEALPIIDPDLIGADDLSQAVPGNPAFDLWQERTNKLTKIFGDLKNKREAQSDGLQGFDAIVSETLGKSAAELLALDKKQKDGADIAPELKMLNLTRPSFMRLLRVRKMVENQTVSEVEWNEVYHLLVQAEKQKNYPQWCEEEKQKRMALTERMFKLSENWPELPPWRATWRARLDWSDKLQARMAQLQAMEDGIRAAVSAVEEQTLPVLRDALVMELAKRWGLKPNGVAEWLTHRLLVDLKTNASQRTTRLIQAIETVQGVLFALRAGQLSQYHPAALWKLTVPEAHFDEEWQWMGSYSTWRAAMIIFFFPETVLLPSLREPYDAQQPFDPLHQTTHFETLLKKLRQRPRLTPDQARIEAGTYLNDLLKDLEMNFNPDFLKWKAAIEETWPSASERPATFLTDHHTDETLGKHRTFCRNAFAQYGNQPPNYIQEIFYGVPLQLAWQLQKSGAYLAALDWYQTVFAYNLPLDKRKIYYGLERETNVAPVLHRSDHWLSDREQLNPHIIADSRTGSNPHTRFTLMSLSRCLMEFADSEFTRDTAESLARARELYLTAQRLLLSPDLDTPPGVSSSDATLLPNPALDLLRLRVEIQLAKMREGRNIAGLKRQVESPVSLPPGPSDLPIIGAGGQLIIPGTRPVQRPTPYYFRVLIERCKQLVNIAQQIEAAYLAALEKRDAENYNLLRANNDLQLAQMGEELQNRRVQEAQSGVGVARAQLQRARVMSERYNMLSSLGLNAFEQQMISSYQEAISLISQAGGASSSAALFGGTSTSLSFAAAAASAFFPSSALGEPKPNIPAGIIYNAAGAAAIAGAAKQSQAAIYSANAQVAQTNASIAGVWASHESRRLDYETQAAIAEQEIAIGEAQIGAAQAHVGVSEQERKIAQTQITQAQAVADFLAKKFTNAELYEWMSGILGEVYSYFLQQATAMAQLAENQLAFERQDTPPKFIQADYWVVPSETGSVTTTDQKAPDRKGLTGSARLLQDIYQLDQYAFETDKRKLNLSQTFSLARMAPFDFEQFRQTGVLTFATPMPLFDRDFPGHYLRLIKCVRTSVIALIPPHHGIRASLIASGISRVVTGGEVFQQVVVRRDPELVALTSPISATGVFELDTQSEMLRPFESMGVDTFWQFEMPRAANPFDFRTIADVLVTIEYTALNSFDYRQQVLKSLNPKLSGERSFIFRQQFADQWYDLHNPEQSATPMTVKFKTWREDFPPNLDGLKIEQILLFFSRVVDDFAEEKPPEVEVKSLRFTQKGEKDAVGGGATTIDGVISTRRGNGASWNVMIGKTPEGEWELELPDTEEMKKQFKDEKIQDILLVITYGGRTPAWPV